jgi:hypothetical protein
MTNIRLQGLLCLILACQPALDLPLKAAGNALLECCAWLNASLGGRSELCYLFGHFTVVLAP